MHQKTVLIIRCSSGIGCSAALDFLGEGREAYVITRNPANIETPGERGASIVMFDVTDQGDVDRVVDHIVDEQGHIDCLVNNTGYGQMGPIEDVSTEKVHDQFDVNIYGSRRPVRVVLPHMRSQGDGTIANVSSVVGRAAFPGTGVYTDSKFTLKAVTDALRTEVEEYGTDAVLIEPDLVETQFSNRIETEVNGDDDKADGLGRSGAYEKLYKLFDDSQVFGNSGPGTIPPEQVTGDTVNTASSTKPWACYQPGTAVHVGALARFLLDT